MKKSTLMVVGAGLGCRNEPRGSENPYQIHWRRYANDAAHNVSTRGDNLGNVGRRFRRHHEGNKHGGMVTAPRTPRRRRTGLNAVAFVTAPGTMWMPARTVMGPTTRPANTQTRDGIIRDGILISVSDSVFDLCIYSGKLEME
ncbi:hypothetical protein Sjap_018714 [Stephania japonica]|uniref:Uncharacterized protein n=1 Tax=Stephania japonica TaxID=461633 RepID=A0AAP0I8J1_9MAGN